MLNEKLKVIISKQIDLGNALETRTKAVGQTKDLDAIISEYDLWNKQNKFTLEKGFVQQAQQFFRMYDGVNYLGNDRIKEGTFEYKRDKLIYCLPKQISHLRTTLAQLQSIHLTSLLPIDESENITIQKPKAMKKLFLSHSSQDKALGDLLVDLLHSIGVKEKEIFYSSSTVHGISLGRNIFDELKKVLDAEALVLFMFSDNFFKSPVCLCEMGATWIKTHKHVPILIPPFNFENVKGVFPNSIGLKINDKEQLNNLKIEIEKEFDLDPIHQTTWERKRDKFISDVNVIIEKTIAEKKESEIMIFINSSPDKRIKRSDLKQILGEDPQDPHQIGNITLRHVYLNSDFYQIS